NSPIYITITDFKGIQRESIAGVAYEYTPGEERTIDLTPYHIVVQDNFVISLEYVKELGEGKLQLKTGILSGKTFFRKTSQAEWHSAPLGLGMSVLIRYKK
ncbi:MAG: hypothetical protein U9Q77_05560, partial [Candidatus Marinimicrobia bacterium]|nr:hypothetical protein [Candidatus Neomarinimicrobiota bacterium]